MCPLCHNLGWYIEDAPVMPVDAGHLLHLKELYEALGEPITIITCNCKEDPNGNRPTTQAD